MTKKEAAIMSAFTGYMVGSFSDLQSYADTLFGYPTFTHQFGNEAFANELKEKATPDFMEICRTLTE